MRLTLDWDNISFDVLLQRIRVLRHFYPSQKMQVERSSGGKGYHAVIFDATKSFKEQINLREKFWDDEKRIAIDRQRWKKGVPASILFTEKRGKYIRRY